MRSSFRIAVAVVAFAPLALSAQGASACAVANSDACQKAEDMYSYLLPQLGLGLAGGNPVLGSSSVIGKLGHFSLGVRGTVFHGSLPQFDNTTFSSGGRVASDLEVKKQILGAGGADAAIGLFRGFAVGTTHLASLDALASLTYLPDITDNSTSEGDANITVKTHSRFGFGGRLGLLDESFVIPSVSVTYLQRGLPKISLNTESDGTQLGVQDLDVRVTTWRVIATKNFLAFSFTGGIGGDKYKSDATITAQTAGVSAANTSTLARDLSRTNWFVDFTINLGPVKLAAEYGQGGKMTVDTFNHFDPEAGAARTYASAGLRIGF